MKNYKLTYFNLCDTKPVHYIHIVCGGTIIDNISEN